MGSTKLGGWVALAIAMLVLGACGDDDGMPPDEDGGPVVDGGGGTPDSGGPGVPLPPLQTGVRSMTPCDLGADPPVTDCIDTTTAMPGVMTCVGAAMAPMAISSL